MGNRELRDFEINIIQLDNSRHDFTFELDDEFFNLFPESLIEKGKGSAFLTLEKTETMMQLDIHIELTVELVCDLSLKKFDFPIDLRKQVIFKFGEEDKELSEDVRVIVGTTPSINIANYLYEFANLGIPMKKVHPDLVDKARPDLFYTDESDSAKDSEVDPRWEVLKKLK